MENRREAISPLLNAMLPLLHCNNIFQLLQASHPIWRKHHIAGFPVFPGYPCTSFISLVDQKTHLNNPSDIRMHQSMLPRLWWPPFYLRHMTPGYALDHAKCYSLVLSCGPAHIYFTFLPTHPQFQQVCIKCYYVLGNVWSVEDTKLYNTQSLCSRRSCHSIKQTKNCKPEWHMLCRCWWH